MPRAKNTSAMLDEAAFRLQGMKSISPTLDLGSDLTIATMEAVVGDARLKQDLLNQHIAELEEYRSSFKVAEKLAGKYSSRVLSATAAKYGRDSVEYAQVGGTRTQDKRRRSSKKKPPEDS